METATHNDKVYAKIGKFRELNIVHTGEKKLKKLKQDYQKIKDHNNRSGSEQQTSKWFFLLLLAFSGTAPTKDSSTELLEAIDPG